jgi:hypothetical protein
MPRPPGPKFNIKLANTNVYVRHYSTEMLLVTNNINNALTATSYHTDVHVARLRDAGYDVEIVPVTYKIMRVRVEAVYG